MQETEGKMIETGAVVKWGRKHLACLLSSYHASLSPVSGGSWDSSSSGVTHFAYGSVSFSSALDPVFVRAEGAGCNLSHQGIEACPGDALGKAELLGYIFLFSLHGALKLCENHFQMFLSKAGNSILCVSVLYNCWVFCSVVGEPFQWGVGGVFIFKPIRCISIRELLPPEDKTPCSHW